jgi:hypothetical protein
MERKQAAPVQSYDKISYIQAGMAFIGYLSAIAAHASIIRAIPGIATEYSAFSVGFVIVFTLMITVQNRGKFLISRGYLHALLTSFIVFVVCSLCGSLLYTMISSIAPQFAAMLLASIISVIIAYFLMMFRSSDIPKVLSRGILIGMLAGDIVARTILYMMKP